MHIASPFGLIEHLRTSNDCGEELRRDKMNDDLLANRTIRQHRMFGISLSVCSSNTPFPPLDNLIILVKLESSGDSPSRYDTCLSTCLFTALCSACLKMKRTTGNFKQNLNILSLNRKKCCDWRKRHQYVSPDFLTGISLHTLKDIPFLYSFRIGMHFVTAIIHTT